MKRTRWSQLGQNGLLLLTYSLVLLVMASGGCRKSAEVRSVDELAAAFEGSAAEQDALAALTAFQEGRHREAVYLLHKVAGRGDMDERQKQAMVGIVGQVMQVVHNDPKLSADRKLHRMIELLILQTMGET